MRLQPHQLLLGVIVGTVLPARATEAQDRPPAASSEAAAYLSAALDTLEAIVLGRDTLPWSVIRDSAFALAAGAQKPRDTYGALDWALRRAHKHSFLQAGAPGAVSTLVRGSFGYVRVPQRGGQAVALADSLHTAIRTLQDAGACGWIVDLRGNGGGNMWPMLAGVGPLLGDSTVGSFGTGREGPRWYYQRGTSGLIAPDGKIDTLSQVTVPVVHLRQPMAPIAMLVDAGTGSSGEALAVAFWGRPNTRSFGSPTAGFATANRGSRLPDGANMVVTTGYYTDRRGTVHGDQLQPDTLIVGGAVGWPFPTDRVAEAAAAWLGDQALCEGRRPQPGRGGRLGLGRGINSLQRAPVRCADCGAWLAFLIDARCPEIEGRLVVMCRARRALHASAGATARRSYRRAAIGRDRRRARCLEGRRTRSRPSAAR